MYEETLFQRTGPGQGSHPFSQGSIRAFTFAVRHHGAATATCQHPDLFFFGFNLRRENQFLIIDSKCGTLKRALAGYFVTSVVGGNGQPGGRTLCGPCSTPLVNGGSKRNDHCRFPVKATMAGAYLTSDAAGSVAAEAESTSTDSKAGMAGEISFSSLEMTAGDASSFTTRSLTSCLTLGRVERPCSDSVLALDVAVISATDTLFSAHMATRATCARSLSYKSSRHRLITVVLRGRNAAQNSMQMRK